MRAFLCMSHWLVLMGFKSIRIRTICLNYSYISKGRRGARRGGRARQSSAARDARTDRWVASSSRSRRDARDATRRINVGRRGRPDRMRSSHPWHPSMDDDVPCMTSDEARETFDLGASSPVIAARASWTPQTREWTSARVRVVRWACRRRGAAASVDVDDRSRGYFHRRGGERGDVGDEDDRCRSSFGGGCVL